MLADAVGLSDSESEAGHSEGSADADAEELVAAVNASSEVLLADAEFDQVILGCAARTFCPMRISVCCTSCLLVAATSDVLLLTNSGSALELQLHTVCPSAVVKMGDGPSCVCLVATLRLLSFLGDHLQD